MHRFTKSLIPRKGEKNKGKLKLVNKERRGVGREEPKGVEKKERKRKWGKW